MGVSSQHVSHVLCDLRCQPTANGINGYARKITEQESDTCECCSWNLRERDHVTSISLQPQGICITIGTSVLKNNKPVSIGQRTNMHPFFYYSLVTSLDTH